MASLGRAGQRVLVIDDDVGIGHAVRRALGRYDVSIAETAAEGLALAVAIEPDLVILDFYLPDSTGRDVIAALRDRGVTAPVLLTSGALGLDELTDWVAYLADDFLAKPFHREALLAKAERLLFRHTLEKRVARQHAELVAMHEANERETDATRLLLDRMLQRAAFDPATIRIDTVSAGRFGGDAVFGHALPDGRYRWLVGDATGHTLASALVTIPISMIFYATARDGVPLPEVMAALDRELAAMLPVTMFFTACVGELDRARGTLTVANAAMPDLLIHRRGGGLEAIASNNLPLGVHRHGASPLALTTVPVEVGDRIYSFSDGLTEVRDGAGELFGLGRVRAVLASLPRLGAFGRLATAWRDHAGGVPPDDDVSVVEIVV